MVANSKLQIISLIQGQDDKIRSYGVTRLGLFGSFVRGEQNKDSDVDILVEFEPTHKTYRNFVHLAFFLEDLLGRRVELVTPEALSPHIGPHIRREVQYVAL
jgi:hypothetical protein